MNMEKVGRKKRQFRISIRQANGEMTDPSDRARNPCGDYRALGRDEEEATSTLLRVIGIACPADFVITATPVA